MTTWQYGMVWVPFVGIVFLGYLEIRKIRRIMEELRDVQIYKG